MKRTEMIDRFAEIDSQMSDLKKESDGLKATLIKAGLGNHLGATEGISVTVYKQSGKTTFDLATLRSKLTAAKVWKIVTVSAGALKTAVKAGVVPEAVMKAATRPGEPGIRLKVVRQ